MKARKVLDTLNKSGVIVLLPEKWSETFTRTALQPLPLEDLEFPDEKDILRMGVDQPCVRIVRRCIDADHFAFQCPTRLPLILEAQRFPIISWDHWVEKYGQAKIPEDRGFRK